MQRRRGLREKERGLTWRGLVVTRRREKGERKADDGGKEEAKSKLIYI